MATSIRLNDPEQMFNSIAEEFGTPCYVYDSNKIHQSYTSLKQSLSTLAEVFFSFKSNPNISIATHLRQLGAGAEVSSLTELTTAQRAGFIASQIIFVGPLKTRAELEAALDSGIFAIVVETVEELSLISWLALRAGLKARVALRINPNFQVKEAPIKMSGVATKFGFSEDWVRAHPSAFSLPNIEIIGIHIYNGSRILDADAIGRNVGNILALSEELAKLLRFTPEMVDVGGGMGVPYFKGENPLDLRRLQECVEPHLAAFREKFPGCRIIFESGRFLVAPSGTMVTRVYSVKESHGEWFAVVDAGFNCHMSASGLGTVVQRNFPVSVYGENPSGEMRVLTIGGPLCTPGDAIAKKIELRGVEPGSLIAIEYSGAYGPSASPTFFIGHGYPAEILVHEGMAHLVRERDTVEDILRKQRNIFDQIRG